LLRLSVQEKAQKPMCYYIYSRKNKPHTHINLFKIKGVKIMNTNKSYFWLSAGGRFLITLINTVVLWGLMYLFIALDVQIVTLIIAFVCAYFGWQTINMITPAMFIWMSWTGWIVYFLIKFLISVAIGTFVAPYKIGKSIAGLIQDSMAY
jgi:hypothetical protein